MALLQLQPLLHLCIMKKMIHIHSLLAAAVSALNPRVMHLMTTHCPAKVESRKKKLKKLKRKKKSRKYMSKIYLIYF